jgi:hypothetical protein
MDLEYWGNVDMSGVPDADGVSRLSKANLRSLRDRSLNVAC